MYLHEIKHWWNFRFDAEAILSTLGRVRAKQGRLMGDFQSLGFSANIEETIDNLSIELRNSSLIEGENLPIEQIRSSIARRLGVEKAGLVTSSRYIDGIVEMMLDATNNYNQELSDSRLFGWHNTLFPTGRNGLYEIAVGQYRTGDMQVVSGPMGHETVHYEAPSSERVPQEMSLFIEWFNKENSLDPLIKAAEAHLRFVTIHPFDDGNGRIARALTEMLLCRADESSKRFYSLSNQIFLDKNNYYRILEQTQKDDGDISEWLNWFLTTLEKALDHSAQNLSAIIEKAKFWQSHAGEQFNHRQKKLLDMQFEGFFGKLSTGKWAKIAKCSTDTALNDINDLVSRGILRKDVGRGRSTSYYIYLEKPLSAPETETE